LCQLWLNLAKWLWRRSRKCKSLQTDGRRAIRKAHLSFQLRWAKKENILVINLRKNVHSSATIKVNRTKFTGMVHNYKRAFSHLIEFVKTLICKMNLATMNFTRNSCYMYAALVTVLYPYLHLFLSLEEL
jgi:hypothetical protein